MGRWKALPDNARLGWFLVWVNAHPWARLSHIAALSDLGEHGTEVALALAEKRGLVERLELAETARAERRCAITAGGAAAIGQPYDRVRLRDSFLQAQHLDLARQLLREWAPRISWAVSPLVIPSRDVRPVRPPGQHQPKRDKNEPGNGPYRSLRLDALVCLWLHDDYFVHLAIQAEPGLLDTAWSFQQYRSLHAWSKRDTWHGQPGRFPNFLVLASNGARREALMEAWREAAGSYDIPEKLRMMGVAELDQPAEQRVWKDEHGQRMVPPWQAGHWFQTISAPPGLDSRPWLGGKPVPPASPSPSARKHAARKHFVSGLTAERAQKNRQAALLYAQRTLSARGRNLLAPIGQYPLIQPKDLAIVLGRSRQAINSGLQDLLELKLIEHPATQEPGYVLTSPGLALLAANVGMRPAEYARLRHWPTRPEGHALAYSAQGLLACQAHTRLVLDFLVGLRRYGPRARLGLVAWEHVDCLYEYPFETLTGAPSKRPPKDAKDDVYHAPHPAVTRIIPDATGIVVAAGDSLDQVADTSFWLEVDRGTERGRALLDKFTRYYRHAQRLPPWERQLPRLLIVVEHNDQPRLDYLCRRLIALEKRYKFELDVRLTRADRLATSRHGLDPTRKVWRTLHNTAEACAFNQLPPAALEPKP